jgi:hypothetical protein
LKIKSQSKSIIIGLWLTYGIDVLLAGLINWVQATYQCPVTVHVVIAKRLVRNCDLGNSGRWPTWHTISFKQATN